MPPRKSKADHDIRRINLCFDLMDTRQKVVYEYLSSLDKKKTEAVVDLCLRGMTHAQGDADKPVPADQDEIIRCIKELFDQLDARLSHKLENLTVTLPSVKAPEPSALPAALDLEDIEDEDDGMSDDAFSDMMALSSLL